MRRRLAAGNWKMNGTRASLDELRTLAREYPAPGCDVVICPPATLLERASRLCEGSAITCGGQDCHAAPKGAHTGDISAEMLADAGAEYVILGHSERRADHRETDDMVAAKTQAAWRAGLTAILCVGESEAQRDSGATLDVIAGQLDASVPEGADGDNLVIAYEPIWAIGTGRVPQLSEIGEVHDFMRARLAARFGPDSADDIRLLYGGSMNPANAADIISVRNVDGGLVGGASLKADDFGRIIAALGA